MPIHQGFRLVEPVRFQDLCQLNTGDVMAMPTLRSGHFDDLKFDNGQIRLWASRMTRRDYEDADAWARDRFVVEDLKDGVWVRLGCMCPLAPCSRDRRGIVHRSL